MYKRYRNGWLKHWDFMVLDVLAQQLAFIISYCLYNRVIHLPYAVQAYGTIGVLLVLLDGMFMLSTENMQNILKRGYYIEFMQTLKLCLLDFASITLILFILKISVTYSRVILFTTFGLHCLLSWLFRILWKRHLRQTDKTGSRSMILVIDEANISTFLARSSSTEETEVVGLVLTNRDAAGETVCGIPVVANMDDAAMYICREWVDEVFVYPNSLSQIERAQSSSSSSRETQASSSEEATSTASIIEDDFFTVMRGPASVPSPAMEGSSDPLGVFVRQCREMAIPIHIRLGINGLGGKNFVEKVNGFNVITATTNYASPFQLFIKRCIDIVGGILGSFIALLVMLIVGPKIKKESPGPLIYKQWRIGQNGKKFQIYKIRSMYTDADERKKEFLAQNRVSDGMMFKLDFDPRIIGNKILPDGTHVTGIGEFIRSHSLDEFPQFWNVLKGDMSIVGTRPPTLDEWEKYQYHHRARLSFKPGVTGMWQGSGRSNITDFEEVVKLGTEYIEHWSIGLDIRLIFKTIKNMVSGEGAL